MGPSRRPASLATIVLLAAAAGVRAADAPLRLRAIEVTQGGSVKPDEAPADGVLLANESDGGTAWAHVTFDLAGFAHPSTPRAMMGLPGFDRAGVKRPGAKMLEARGALHVYAPDASGTSTYSAACPVKPGGKSASYVIDVTDAVNAALANKQKRLELDVKMLGLPSPSEVYKLLTTPADVLPTLDLSSPENVPQDWKERLAPIDAAPVVYREACLPIVKDLKEELTLKLLYPAKRVVEVIRLRDGAKLEEGRDWQLRDGKVVLPAGTQAPVQLDAEFFLKQPKPTTDPTTVPAGEQAKPTRTAIQLMEGTWYQERQMEVTYEPASRAWQMPAMASSPDKLPRTLGLLKAGKPVRIVLFGDSIAWGGNSSRLQGAWPFQPSFGALVAWQLGQLYKSPITFMNHSRGGGTSAFGLTQVESQVGWFKPDLCILAFGMNDRGDVRRPLYRSNMEQIIDRTRAVSPETEFVFVTSMINNPKQPTGLDPVKFLRDEALKIERPGVAFADMTSAHLAIVAHKDYLDTSGNGANHPNDFLHRVYAQTILKLFAPDAK